MKQTREPLVRMGWGVGSATPAAVFLLGEETSGPSTSFCTSMTPRTALATTSAACTRQ